MIEIKRIDVPFEAEKIVTQEVKFQPHKTIRNYLEENRYGLEGYRVILNGKVHEDLDVVVSDKSQIILINEVADPVTAAIGAFIWTAFTEYTLITVGVILAVASVTYTLMNMPKAPALPSFGAMAAPGGGRGGIEEASPTYGWDGARTTQDVGIPVPVIYGEHIVGGNKINEYIWTDGDKNYLNILLALAEGEIDSISTLKVNQQPIANFDGVAVTERYGTNSQSIIENFEDLHNLYDVNVQLLKDVDYDYTTVDIDVEAFEVHFQLPSGLYQQSEADGSIKSWTVTYQVQYREHLPTPPAWIDLGTTTISVKQRTAVRRIYRKDGLSAAQYDIRVTRTSDDSSTYKVGDIYLQRIDEIKRDDLIYPNTALLGLELLATNQLSGASPNITCVIKGTKVSQPKIMTTDPTPTQVNWIDYYHDGTDWRLLADDSLLNWDGVTWVTEWCANPIWCMKDLFINDRYGLGEYITAATIDNAAFLEMAKHCDERVSDGEGGYEKRFRLDIVLDSAVKALDLVNQICTTFRCFPFYSEGKVMLKIDKPETPVQVFGMGNIIEGSFTQHWKSIKETPNQIDVTFVDSAKDYRQETVSIVDQTAIQAGDPRRVQAVRVFTTSASQALREGRFLLNRAKYISRSVGWGAGIDGVAVQAGDLVYLSHDVPQWGSSGRVTSGSTVSLVKLASSVIIESGAVYKIRIRHGDTDIMEETTITDGPGTYTEVNVSPALGATPSQYDIYVVGKEDILVKPFRVMSLQRKGNNEVTMLGLEYNASLYDDSEISVPTSNYSVLSVGVPGVENLSLTERLVKQADGTIENAVDVWFQKPEVVSYKVRQYDHAKVYLSDDNVQWVLRGETTGAHFPIIGDLVSKAIYYVKVSAVSNGGVEENFSDAPVVSIELQGKAAAPSDITAFLVNQNRDRMYFGWSEISDVDIWGYEIRVGGDWGSGQVVAFVQGDHYLTTNFAVGVSQSYWIKAIDTSGNYSENEKEAVVTVDSIPFRNIVQEYSEQTAWGAGYYGTYKDGNNLKLLDTPLAHYKCNDNAAATAVDDDQNNYEANCSVNTDTISTTGKISLGLELDGDTVNINCGDIAELNEAFEFSLVGWFKQDILDVEDTIFYKYKDASNWIRVYTDSGGVLNVEIRSGGATYKLEIDDYSDFVTVGTFFHLAIVIDLTQITDGARMVVYIDNVAVGSDDYTFSGTAPAMTSDLSGCNFYIGYTSGSFDGVVDDVRIYQWQLTTEQVTALYNSGGGSESSTPVGAENLKGSYVTPIRDVGYVATFAIGVEAVSTISQGLGFDTDSTRAFSDDSTRRFSGAENPYIPVFRLRMSEDNVTWTAWEVWQNGDYKCRYFQIQVELQRGSGDVVIVCTLLNYYADLPDVDEFSDGVETISVAADGVSVTFAKTYHETPVVSVDIASGTGVYYKATNIDTTGFDVHLYDIAGNAVTGTFNWKSHGV